MSNYKEVSAFHFHVFVAEKNLHPVFDFENHLVNGLKSSSKYIIIAREAKILQSQLELKGRRGFTLQGAVLGLQRSIGTSVRPWARPHALRSHYLAYF